MSPKRRRTGLIHALVLSMAVMLIGATGSQSTPAPAGRFIVTLTDGSDARAVAAEYERRGGTDVDYVYTAALRGFAGDLSDGALARARADGRVTRVERDGVATTQATTTQSDATWGIDRTDQRYLDLDTKYSYAHTGAGVAVYVIDTGIRTSHQEFEGRATHGYDAIDDDMTSEDCHGHGTHVAGTVGGKTYGIAKAVKLVAVRVLDCGGSGTWSGVISGIDWVTAQHVANSPSTPSVANMSLGGGANSSVDDAIARSTAAGVVHAVAAGNDRRDACRYSPARAPSALTVAATTSSDYRASYSNHGSCVDLFAPGSSITSATYTSDTSTGTKSGTSMASPHVAGVAALYLEANPTAGVDAVSTAIVGNATAGVVIDGKSGAGDVLLHSLFSPTDPVTDIAVTAVTAPTSVTQGDIVPVDVTVSNVGNQAVTSVTVTLEDGSTQIGSTTLGLAAGETRTLPFSWTTTTETPTGDHVLTASHGLADGNATNDSETATVTVTAPGSTVPVDVTGVTSSATGTNTLTVGTQTVTITGSGFATGAVVELLNGKGHTPTISAVTVDDTGTTITATVLVENKGPSSSWDLRVTVGAMSDSHPVFVSRS